MDSLRAIAMGYANSGKELMVFDWNKAARLIKENEPEEAGAGLQNDWEWTGGTIYKNGKPVTNSYTYLASTWATPELDMDGFKQPCFLMASRTDFTKDTKWPESALAILKESKP
jgi:hypothetical protein